MGLIFRVPVRKSFFFFNLIKFQEMKFILNLITFASLGQKFMKQQTKHAHHLVESFLTEESKKICSVFWRAPY